MNVYGFVPSDLDPILQQEQRIQLTDDPVNPTGQENTTITQESIDRCVARFHNKAGEYYVIPIAPRRDATPGEAADLATTVKDLIVGMSAYDLMRRQPKWLDGSEQAKFWSVLNKQNNDTLDGLQSKSRDVKFPAALEKTNPVSTTGGASVQSDCSRYTRDSMRSFS